MTEADVIREMREYLESLFPRNCPNCQRRFESLREYLQITTHQGLPIPYDVQAGDWQPSKPVGTVTMSNCPCGTTLALSSNELRLPRLWRLLNWARTETRRRNLTPQELLTHLRDEICKQVLGEPDPGGKTQGGG
ncbi:MAG: hypothetical protein ABSH48_17870 [Verrucomicrobiota bacterium]